MENDRSFFFKKGDVTSFKTSVTIYDSFDHNMYLSCSDATEAKAKAKGTL
jgi:hypothetical protein